MTRPRTRTLTGAAALGLLLIAPVAGPAAASDHLETTTDGGKTVLKLVERENEGGQYIPKGGEPQDFPEDEDFVPSVGDAFTFTSDLLQSGREVGTDSGTCTLVELETNTHHCVVKFVFDEGTFLADGTVAFPDESDAEPFSVPIVSGTGAFAGARGAVTVAEGETEDGSDLTVVYTTGGQVSQVPTGGAAAGGGLGDGDADGAVLLALGGLAAATGLGLLAGGRRLALRRR